MNRPLVSGLVVSLLTLARPVHAEDGAFPPALLEPPAAAQGYTYSLGLHGGALTAVDEGHTQSALGGYSVALHIGQEIRPWMDLGLVFELGSVVSDQRNGKLYLFGVEWTLRPMAQTFVRLGCGVGYNQVSAAKDSDNKASAAGAVGALTLGYSWFPFRRPRDSGGVSMSPVIRLMSVQPFADSAAYWTTAGFEVAYWTGLPQRQLELPLEDAFPGQAATPAR